MEFSIGLAVSAALRRGNTVPVPPPLVPATLPITPAARWHAGLATVTTAGGRVATASALTGPGVTAGAEGLGPFARTDALGRRYWRFTGSEYLDVGAGLTFSNRAMAVFAVLRPLGGTVVMGIGNRTGYGAGSTATVTTGGAALDVSTTGGTAPFPRVFSRSASLDATNRHRVVAGTQLQVLGGLARTTANGGNRIYVNTDAATVAQSSISASGIIGAEIGRYPFSPGASGTWSGMDLYELVVFDRSLTTAEGDAVAAALVAHWAIPQITSQLVLEGDSISAGAGLILGENAGAVLTAPGMARIPGTYRVFTQAASGNQIADLVTRRDTAAGWASVLLPGSNVLAVEIGRNDMGSITAAQHYANVLAYLNTAGTGVLQRGWKVRVLANIASGASLQSKIDAYRAMLRAPQFVTDTLSGPGQTFDGQVSVVGLDLITRSPDGTIFATTADATDNSYYQGDVTHPTALGAEVRATGADTPQHGIAWGLV
jgi:hypothetical protein